MELEKINSTDSRVESAKKINAAIDAIGNGELADKDLSNLTEEGEKHFLGKSQITNCITEIPKMVDYEITAEGKILVKAGSKYYLPSGVDAVFTEKTLSTDKLFNFTSAQTYTALLAIGNTEEAGWTNKATCGSGTSTDMSIGFYFRTDLGKIYYNKNLEGTTYSLPLMEVDIVEGKVVEVRVFNLCGRIGSFLWVNPNVEVLSATGTNPEGTIKNSIRKTTEPIGLDITSWDNSTSINKGYLMFTKGGPYNILWFQPSNRFVSTMDNTSQTYPTYYYDEIAKKWYLKVIDATTWNEAQMYIYAEMETKNGYFKPKTTFRAVDYSDSSTVSGWGMPSDKYIDLTLGSSGATYTAPANGWFLLNKQAGANGKYTAIYNTSKGGIGMSNHSSLSAAQVVYVPVQKGDSVYISYSSTGATESFRFIYAEGEV